MTPIQQLYLGVGAKKKTYVDDIFSTYLWKGDGNSGRTITNNIDVSGEGALVWMKSRSTGNVNVLFDTERGANQRLRSDSNLAQNNTDTLQPSFTSSGFTVGSGNEVNGSGNDYTSWTFRKAPGFFDVVTYTGNDTNRSIAHSLGCVPGFMMIKRTDDTGHWRCYHKDLGPTKHVLLSSTGAETTGSNSWNDTAPTASVFSLGTATELNNNGSTYVAYLFAGGESDAATARSVDFDGSGDILYQGATDDFHLTGDFTIEGWFYPNSFHNYDRLFCIGNYDVNGGAELSTGSAGQLYFYTRHANSEAVRITTSIEKEQWSHIAIVRSGSTVTMYVNGTYRGSYTQSEDFGAANNKNLRIGAAANNGGVQDYFTGKISNFRIVKGTAVYTSSFRPLTAPLTNITNTKLLCCNNSSTTGSTVAPGTITAQGDPTASSDSPFDDPAGFVFGENGDQGIIKCGISTAGSGGTVTAEQIGWEPQWLLQKQVNGGGSWFINDSMMGWDHTGFNYLRAESANAEANQSGDVGYPLSQGFKFPGNWWSSGNEFIWVAIRRPDGYVGKPIETGTDAFNVVYGNSSSTIPNFASNFPVDIGIYKEPASTYNWYLHTRMTGNKALKTDTSDPQGSSDSDATFDANAGWGKFGYNTDKASWQWRRHAGLDVVSWEGNAETTRFIPHSLGSVPEMILIKSRTDTVGWFVGHKALNGGTDPFGNGYYMMFDTGAETNNTIIWNATPTSTHFNVGNYSGVNGTSKDMIAMLFASISGVSAVGSYTGNGSETGPSISVGFQPRFILLKAASQGGPWRVLDSVRGMSSGNDKSLSLNSNAAQVTNFDWLDVTSTGFDIKTSDGEANANNGNYIYYAHA